MLEACQNICQANYTIKIQKKAITIVLNAVSVVGAKVKLTSQAQKKLQIKAFCL